ncbi:MAG: DUF5606 domain-containing protein [Lishizhenia sp.]
MNLSGIISISGRPGLYSVVAQGKNNVIVQSLSDDKRFPAYASDRISALEDISIYTYEGDVPLKEVYTKIFEKEGGKETISHKESANKLTAYLEEILPDYDRERVYPSDVKKLFQWYNLLHKHGVLVLDGEKESEVEEAVILEESAKSQEKPKKSAPKKAASKGDDLKKIEGAGPKAAEALVNAGLDTFAKVAKAKSEKLSEILTAASSRLSHISTETWPEQAKLAAEGKWDELKALQGKLDGGKK